jgi:hypothetical protein
LQRRAGGVAQGVGPELKPPVLGKKKKKSENPWQLPAKSLLLCLVKGRFLLGSVLFFLYCVAAALYKMLLGTLSQS